MPLWLDRRQLTVPSPCAPRSARWRGTPCWRPSPLPTLKVVVGVTTGSLGILSEALHSALDLVAAIITLMSVRVSDKPADADHQYGHGKVENFSAFLETGLLLLTCIWIIYEAVKRLFFHHVHIEPSLAAFLVMFVSMAVDFWRSRALGRIATKYDSQALEADALHFSTDIWSSGIVVIGLFLVLLGRIRNIDWLRDADPVAALVCGRSGCDCELATGAANSRRPA